MTKTFNELSRVQLPAVLHLMKLGYEYLSYKENKSNIDSENNIIIPILKKQFLKLNPNTNEEDFEKEYQNIKLELKFNDLGQSFFNRIQGQSNYRLIDWDNFNNNTFHVAIEVPCINHEEEFRPDIMIFLNGIPISYIEVKQPNSIRDGMTGMMSEFERMRKRFENKNFRVFHNITQLITFSDNMDYADNDNGRHLQGSYYATTSFGEPVFNSMHEELPDELVHHIRTLSEEEIDYVLKDTNRIVLKSMAEFTSNCNINTPMNKFLSSMYTKERLKFFLHFGIVYVSSNTKDDIPNIQKHIIRYPQYFATRKISESIDNGVKKGIIWHTQGSGKTALAYFNIKYLKHKFQKKNLIPRFYFVVDRLDLAIQASNEFRSRGLSVKLISSKNQLNESFFEDIAVVNIQKINKDTNLANTSGYNLNTQNVYFIDEAHRSYNEKGSYLPNLYNTDKNAIKIALTGTPLISIDSPKRSTTREIFGEYIHKYYYNQSIADGYTLRLIREEISTSYKRKLSNVLDYFSDEVKKGSLNKTSLYSHPNFVSPMLEYIIQDFNKSRYIYDDHTIGGMIVSQSSQQARELYKQFMERKENGKTTLTAALILSDEGDKKTREREINNFKNGKIDFLIVYNMLLTGFDAPRLKKLYLGRMVKAHNLLQTLTRVNRPYKDFNVGYIVDFANISNEFDKTNHAYFEELHKEYSSDTTDEELQNIYGSLFVPISDIESSLENAKIILAEYTTDNLEKFSFEVNEIFEKKELLKLSSILRDLKQYYNISRLIGYDDLTTKIDILEVSNMLTIVNNRISTVNLLNNTKDEKSEKLLKLAMTEMDFRFKKVGEAELELVANDFMERQRKAASLLRDNWDQTDPEWVSLYDEFTRILKKQHIEEFSIEETSSNIKDLDKVINRSKNLNYFNSKLAKAFYDDYKYARTYKHVIYDQKKKMPTSISDYPDLYRIMKKSKVNIDDKVAKNQNMVENQGYFITESISIIRDSIRQENVIIEPEQVVKISQLLADEYKKELETLGV